MASKRVLTLTIELHVPEGLRKDIRWPRVEAAIEQISNVIEGLTSRAFPWADRMVVSYEWADRYAKRTRETVKLPATGMNAIQESE